MALVTVREKIIQFGGGVKEVIYKVTDDAGSGGTLDLSHEFSHLLTVHIANMTRAVTVTAQWTEDSESITVGSEATANDVLKISVVGY